MIMFEILLLACALLHANIKHVLLKCLFSDLYTYIVGRNINLYMYTTHL